MNPRYLWLHDKQRMRKTLQELRIMWNEFDPIGVYDTHFKAESWQQDEYDDYVSKTLSLLVSGANKEETYSFVKAIVTDNIGISWTNELNKDANVLVEKLLAWFKTMETQSPIMKQNFNADSTQ